MKRRHHTIGALAILVIVVTCSQQSRAQWTNMPLRTFATNVTWDFIFTNINPYAQLHDAAHERAAVLQRPVIGIPPGTGFLVNLPVMLTIDGGTTTEVVVVTNVQGSEITTTTFTNTIIVTLLISNAIAGYTSNDYGTLVFTFTNPVTSLLDTGTALISDFLWQSNPVSWGGSPNWSNYPKLPALEWLKRSFGEALQGRGSGLAPMNYYVYEEKLNNSNLQDSAVLTNALGATITNFPSPVSDIRLGRAAAFHEYGLGYVTNMVTNIYGTTIDVFDPDRDVAGDETHGRFAWWTETPSGAWQHVMARLTLTNSAKAAPGGAITQDAQWVFTEYNKADRNIFNTNTRPVITASGFTNDVNVLVQGFVYQQTNFLLLDHEFVQNVFAITGVAVVEAAMERGTGVSWDAMSLAYYGITNITMTGGLLNVTSSIGVVEFLYTNFPTVYGSGQRSQEQVGTTNGIREWTNAWANYYPVNFDEFYTLLTNCKRTYSASITATDDGSAGGFRGTPRVWVGTLTDTLANAIASAESVPAAILTNVHTQPGEWNHIAVNASTQYQAVAYAGIVTGVVYTVKGVMGDNGTGQVLYLAVSNITVIGTQPREPARYTGTRAQKYIYAGAASAPTSQYLIATGFPSAGVALSKTQVVAVNIGTEVRPSDWPPDPGPTQSTTKGWAWEPHGDGEKPSQLGDHPIEWIFKYR